MVEFLGDVEFLGVYINNTCRSLNGSVSESLKVWHHPFKYAVLLNGVALLK